MMKIHLYQHTLFLMWMVALSSLTVSCGLIDMEFDEGIQSPYEMKLDHDTVYVFPEGSFVLNPVFTPDSVSNKEAFFFSDADSIATLKNDSVIAVGVGDTRITAISVLGEKKAYCDVFVMEPWAVNPYDYSNDMVVYAVPILYGKPFNPEKQQIGAFSGPEFRGMGELVEWNGVQFLKFRIYGHNEWGNDEPTAPELIRFACYDSDSLRVDYLPQVISFDGETHGTPSELLQLSKE